MALTGEEERPAQGRSALTPHSSVHCKRDARPRARAAPARQHIHAPRRVPADKPANSIAGVEKGYGATAMATGLEVAAVSRAQHPAESESVVTVGHRPRGDRFERWMPRGPRKLLSHGSGGRV